MVYVEGLEMLRLPSEVTPTVLQISLLAAKQTKYVQSGGPLGKS
jgi:hypothetical protein